MTRVVLIDNYDSFTWNIYEYLVQEGADVQVFRNDQITLAEIDRLDPDILFVSPGPGHPITDSGISRDVIRHYAGKKPVAGVCMGQQCIYNVFGGSVEFAGETVHGKTSLITHDGTGVFDGVSQHVAVTRYHSLAGSKVEVPQDLIVTARSVDSGVIMGVRHKTFTVEGVQFHPESILTQEGHKMIRNFLKMRGGTWEECERLVKEEKGKDETHTKSVQEQSILEKIYAQRQLDVQTQMLVPGRSMADLEKSLALGIAPQQIDFVERLLRPSGKMALMAEIKRASPSKGDIGLDIHAPSQAQLYAEAGAATISVLTEPHWFKGSIQDLAEVRRAVDSVADRPAVLRKEFVFDEYQILEARLAGADTVLLIVKMLPAPVLKRLYDYSLSLKMEPLVEVASAAEMDLAVKLLSPKVIGVNNRDLHTFAVDLSMASSVASLVPKGTILAALSGISEKKHVEMYAGTGVSAVLVGESLMRAKDAKAFIKELVN